MTTGVRGVNFGPGRLQRGVAGTQGMQFTMAAGVSSLKSNPEVAEGAKWCATIIIAGRRQLKLPVLREIEKRCDH